VCKFALDRLRATALGHDESIRLIERVMGEL
jgi:hypothetical protein